MKRYKLSIDVIRFILAVLVIAIHTQPFSGLANTFVVTFLGRLAVPLFFAIYGYYLKRKMRSSTQPEKVVKESILSLIKIYCLSFIIYLPIWFFLNRPVDITKLIVDLFWGGLHYHLWYFPALIVGTIIVYLLDKYLQPNINFFIVLGLYLIGAAMNVYWPAYRAEPFSILLSRNGLFFAPVFILIGFYPFNQKALFSPIIFGALYATEVFFLNHNNVLNDLSSMFISLVILVFLLLPWVVYGGQRTHSSVPFHRVSLSMYIIHPAIIVLLTGISNRLNFNLNGNVLFILTMILSIALSFFYQVILDNRRR